MKIVIDIPESVYEAYKYWNSEGIATIDQSLIADGTVLPKVYGDLIDRSKIHKAISAEEDNCIGMGMTLEEMDAYNEGIDAMYSLVQGAQPIIEADKEADNERLL